MVLLLRFYSRLCYRMSQFTIENVTKSFKKFLVLSDVAFHLEIGEILGIFGKNGSGKSTLLKILFGTLKPDSLVVFIDSVQYFPSKNINDKTVAYLPQDNFLPQGMKVRNVIPLFIQDAEIQDTIFYDPRVVKIENQLIRTLSQGEKRYLEILMISRLPQKFILLDEPFSMIEPLYRDSIKDLLLNIKKEKGIIITDHYYSDVLQITDKNVLIKKGKTIEISDEVELLENGYLSKSSIL